MIVAVIVSQNRVTGVAVYEDGEMAIAEQQAEAMCKPGGATDEVQVWRGAWHPGSFIRMGTFRTDDHGKVR